MSRASLFFVLILAACGGPSQTAEEPPASSGDEAPPPEASGDDPENRGARVPQPTQEALDAAVAEECTRMCATPGPHAGDDCMESCRAAAATIGMECRVDCMPPLDGPCPPPGFSLVCTQERVTY